MPTQLIDRNAPSLQGKFPKHPDDLPHGLIRPPEQVRELVSKERAKFPPEQFTPEVEGRLLNDWTLHPWQARAKFSRIVAPPALHGMICSTEKESVAKAA